MLGRHILYSSNGILRCGPNHHGSGAGGMRARRDEDLEIREVGEAVGSCSVGRFFSCWSVCALSIAAGPEKGAVAKTVEDSV